MKKKQLLMQNNIQDEEKINNFFKVESITKEFDKNSGVKNINFSVNEGEIVGFIGDNGAGKTTTIKLIFGEFIKDAGKVLFENKEISPDFGLKQIAFFPDQNNFPKKVNIVDFAYYSAHLKGKVKKETKEFLDEYLNALNLSEFKKSKFSQLSAGMQKRALLLSVLVTDPKIIILDEPTANLDVKSRLDFMNILNHLAKKYKKTIIITSHNIDELNNIVDRAVIIKKVEGKGQVIYDEKFDSKTQNLRDIYINAIGMKTSNINFEKITQIEEAKSQFNENKVKNNKTFNFLNILNNMPIFQKTFFKMLKSKAFIIVTCLFTACFLLTSIILVASSKQENFKENSLVFWTPFCILLSYVAYYEIHSISSTFNSELKDGVINLEIRSGISKNKIFFERFLANKLIIFTYLILMITLYVIIGAFSNNFYLKTSILAITPGYFSLLLIDLFIFGILTLFITLSSSALSGAIGSIITIFLIFSTLLNFISVGFYNPSFLSNNMQTNDSKFSSKEQNYKYELAYRMQEISKKYGDESIVNKNLHNLYDLKKLVIKIENDKGDYNLYDQYQVYAEQHNLEYLKGKVYTDPDDYVMSLIKNGLLTEIKDLNVYYNIKDLNSKFKLEINEEVFEQNSLIKFLNEIKSFQNINFKYSKSMAEKSLFWLYDKGDIKNNEMLKSNNGLFSLNKKIMKESNTNEINDIVKLVGDAAKYSYQKYIGDKQYTSSIKKYLFASPIERDRIDSDFNRKFDVWLYSIYNNDFTSNIKISDGARTFNKIYVDLLLNYASLEQTNYGYEKNDEKRRNPITSKEYDKSVSKFSYLNPFSLVSRMFYGSGTNKNFLINNNYDLLHQNTFDVKEYNKIKLSENITIDPEFNDIQNIYIKTDAKYFNQPGDESINETQLKYKIINRMNKQIPAEQLDIYLSREKVITKQYLRNRITDESEEFYATNIYLNEENEENLKGWAKITILFNIDSEVQNQEELLKKEFIKKYNFHSTPFNIYKNGRTYVEIIKNKSNFNNWAAGFLFLTVSIIPLTTGYLIFRKKIIQ